MKRLFYIFTILLFVISSVLAQLSIQLNQPPIGQLNIEHLWQFQLTNFSEFDRQVILKATAESQEQGLIFSGHTDPFILEAGFSGWKAMSELGSIYTNYKNSEIESVLRNTGSLPGGFYTLCLRLVDAKNGNDLTQHCLDHRVYHFSPPELIHPLDNEAVSDLNFIWAPPAEMDIGHDYRYELKLVELVDNLSPVDIFNNSEGIYVAENLTATNHYLALESIELREGQKYAWTVYITQPNGRRLSAPNDIQNIGRFTYQPNFLIDQIWEPLEIIEPVENFLKKDETTFQWQPVTSNNVSYYMTIKNPASNDDEPLFFSNELYDNSLTIDLADHEIPETFSVQARVFYTDGTSETGPERNYSFQEETLDSVDCDTNEVNNHIESVLGEIQDDLCDKKMALLDSILAAFATYENSLWKRDSLNGMIETAKDFTDRLKQLKKTALTALKAELDKTKNLTANGQNCYPDWKSIFYTGYVTKRGGSQSRYNRYIRKYEDRFNRCKDRWEHNIQDDIDDITDEYDDKIQDNENLIQQLTNQKNQKENEVANAKKKLNDLLQEMIDNLCNLTQQWTQLIQYMMENIICVECTENYNVLPPQFKNMNDCLRNIFEKLYKLNSNFRSTLSTSDLQAEADNFFDVSEMENLIAKVKQLKTQFTNLIASANQGGNLRAAHPCCEGFAELANGHYLYVRQEKSANYQDLHTEEYGLGTMGVVLLPGTGSGASENYSDAKRKFRRNRAKINKQMDRALRKLNNSYSTSTSSGISIEPPIEHGLSDEKAIEKHGKVTAVPYHLQSKAKLSQLVQDFFDAVKNCFTPRQQRNFHLQYTNLLHRCYDYQQALNRLDDAYENYQEKLDRLRDELHRRINGVPGNSQREGVTENARQDSTRNERLRQRLEKLQEKIESLTNEINSIDQTAEHEQQTDINRKKAELRQKRAALIRQLEKLKKQISENQAEIERLQELIRRLGNRIDNLPEPNTTRPVGSEDECEELIEEIENREEELEEEAEKINNALDNAEQQQEEIEKSDADSAEELEEMEDEADDLSDEIADAARATAREAIRLRNEELLAAKRKCLRLLADYFNKNNDKISWFDWFLDLFSDVKKEFDDIPASYLETIDDFKEFLNDIEGGLDKIKEISKVINGLLKKDINSRARAFGSVIKLSGELANKVPGFGDMIAFYAEAYQSALAGIEKIKNEITGAFKPLADNYIRQISCDPKSWGNLSLDQILDNQWKQFKKRNSKLIEPQPLGIRNALEAYFKRRAHLKILECCLNKIAQPGETYQNSAN